MFVQSLRLPALTQSSNSGFFFEAGWFVLFFYHVHAMKQTKPGFLENFTLYSKPLQEAAVWLHYSEETNATFYSQWGHIGGCWSTWASSASPLLKGGSLRGLKRSEIEQRRLMSHKLCLLQIIPFLHRCCSSQQRCTGIHGPTTAVMPVPIDMGWSLAALPGSSPNSTPEYCSWTACREVRKVFYIHMGAKKHDHNFLLRRTVLW